MPDFSQFEDEAKKEAGEHSQQVDQGIDKAGDVADKETGNRFDSEIQKGEQAGENYLGGQQQGGQQQQPDQQQQSQDQGQYGGDQGGQYGDQGSQGQGGYGDQGSQDQGQGGGQY